VRLDVIAANHEGMAVGYTSTPGNTYIVPLHFFQSQKQKADAELMYLDGCPSLRPKMK
jgi:hypothetical protein